MKRTDLDGSPVGASPRGRRGALGLRAFLGFSVPLTAEDRREGQRMIKAWMDELKKTGRVEIGGKTWEAVRRDFDAVRVSDEEVRASLGGIRASPTLIHVPQTDNADYSETLPGD